MTKHKTALYLRKKDFDVCLAYKIATSYYFRSSPEDLANPSCPIRLEDLASLVFPNSLEGLASLVYPNRLEDLASLVYPNRLVDLSSHVSLPLDLELVSRRPAPY